MGHWGFRSILKALPLAHNLSWPALTELLSISHLTIPSLPQISLQNLVLAHFCFAQPGKRVSLELRKNMQLSSDYCHYRNPVVTSSAHIQSKFQPSQAQGSNNLKMQAIETWLCNTLKFAICQYIAISSDTSLSKARNGLFLKAHRDPQAHLSPLTNLLSPY